MGCSVWSKENSLSSFEVINIDVKGNERFYGRMEITPYNMVFNRDDSGRQIVWPLCTIKKYGHEYSIFYLQAGRVSPSGQGVFAFKTKNARGLFDAVKRQTESGQFVKRQKKLLSKARVSSKRSHTTSGGSTQNDYDEIAFGGSIRSLGEFNNIINDNNNNNSNNDSGSSSFDLNIQPLGAESPEIYMNTNENLEVPYTEVEIVVRGPPAAKNKSQSSSPTRSKDAPNYTTIDFARTMQLSRNMMKSVDDTGIRRTRHDTNGGTLSVENE